jgi:hypothetical protein
MASQYYKVTAYVGTPHRNAVEVTIPLVGPVGATGATGPAGESGDVVEVYTVTGSTFTVPDVRAARVFIDQPGAFSNVTVTLNASAPQNLDRVEIFLVRIQSGFDVTVAVPGFPSFDLYGTQKATFVYGANIGPARWVKAFDNVFQEAEPQATNSFGQPGLMAYANNFIYICVGNNNWRRVAVSEWTTP